MAIKRFGIQGYGQLELNNVVFPRDGHIEAQCKLNPDDFSDEPAEVGMLLAVDRVNRIVKKPVSGEKFPIALHYSTEHMYDERATGLKYFALPIDSFLPRMGYPSAGEVFTSNCLAYDDGEFSSDDDVIAALETLATTPIYGGACENGAIKLSATAPTEGPVLQAAVYTTMPDGQPAVRFHVLSV